MTYPYAGLYSDDIRSKYNRLLPNTAVTVYLHGSNTLATLYTDRSKLTPLANPIHSDSAGNVSFYADPGLYDITGDGVSRVTVAVVPDPGDLGGGGSAPTIMKNGSVVGAQPAINFIQGANITLTLTNNTANSRVDVQVTASGGSGTGLAAVVLYNVETYGAVGDGVTDDFLAFQAAFNAMFTSNAPGLVLVPNALKTYRVVLTGRIVHGSADQYAAIPVPKVTNLNTGMVTWGMIGPADANSLVGRQFPTSGQTSQGRGAPVVLLDYSSPFAWSSTFGHPSFIGGPDATFSTVGGTDVHWYQRGVIMRQPDNPSVCGINMRSMQACTILDLYADTNVAPDLAVEPTHPTGTPLLWPRAGNSAVLYAGKLGCWGYFAGYGHGEHLFAAYVYVVRTKIAHPVYEVADHACQFGTTVSEECPFVIAGYDPSSAVGIVAVPGVVKWTINCLDIEDFPAGVNGWTYTRTVGSHVYDANNNLRGVIWYMVQNSGSVPPTAGTCDLIGKGQGSSGNGMAFLCLLDAGTRHLVTQTGFDPCPGGATVPGAPTGVSAVAGNQSGTITFTPPVSNGGATIASYTATASPGGITATGSASPIVITGLTNGVAYTATVHATNCVGNSVESSASNSFTPTGGGGFTNIFTSQTPAIPNANDSVPYTLGTLFTSSTNRNINGIRWFFPGTLPDQPVIGLLYRWDSDTTGTELARATFTGAVAGQWNSCTFSSPVAITASTKYVAAIWTHNTYVATTGFFTGNSVTNGGLTAPADDAGTPVRNGRLDFSGSSTGPTYPATSASGSCFFPDVNAV